MKSLVLKLGQGWLRGGRELAARSGRSAWRAAPEAAASAAAGDASAALFPRAWLHIRSGLHRGGAVALHDGVYRIGASLDDDVVLHDTQMLVGHLHIDVDAQSLRLTAQAPGWRGGDAALLPNTPLELTGTTWHKPQTLQLGNTRIELTWGPALSAAAEQAPAEPSLASAPSAASAAWWATAVRQCGLVSMPVKLAAGVIVAAGLLATFAFVGMGSGPGPAPLRPGPGGRDLLQAAQQHLNGRVEWQNLAFRRVPALGVELRGSVERRDDLNKLLRLPEVAALLPLVRVVVGQELRRQIQDLAGDPAIQVDIGPVPAQELSAQSSPNAGANTSANTSANAGDSAGPNAGQNAGANAGAKQPPADPSGRASAKASTPSDARQRVVVTGKTQRADIAASLQMLNIEFGGRIEIVDRTVYENSTGNEKKVRTELPFTIASVNTGEGYIESSDGARYFEGGVVSGYRVESIEQHNVVFSVNGKRINFPLN
jgi:Inner membrane component of T3SS, cytoplasmic domain